MRIAAKFILQTLLVLMYAPPIVLTGLYPNHAGSHGVHFISSCCASAHLAYLCSIYITRYVQSKHPLLYFYKHNICIALCGYLTICILSAYNYAVFERFIFDSSKPYYTSLSILMLYSILATMRMSCVCFMFWTHHQKKFIKIIEHEQAITFDGRLKQIMEVGDCLEHQSIEVFVKYWKNLAASEVIHDIPAKTTTIFKIVCDNLDENNDSNISYDEFVMYAHKNNVDSTEKLWKILTAGLPVTNFNRDVLEYMLYHALFQKKQLAHAIETDAEIATWLVSYAFVFLIPLNAIIISHIWGYYGAFNGNFNLFQLYILAATFFYDKISENVRFVVYMFNVRPFNIGELLYLFDDVYKVEKVTPNFIQCLGGDTIILKTNQLLNTAIHNYSRSHVNDSVTFEMPMNTSNACLEKIKQKMTDYATEHWNDISVDSIRCGWVKINECSNAIQCNWQYNFMIYDRKMFNMARSRFVNETIVSVLDDVIRCFLLVSAAHGGAMNDFVQKNYMCSSNTSGSSE
jgi:hypothetical protein